ncbi:MAG: hypothetical protein ABSH46_23670 [Bryobacteraceae bacterium]|jgi:hypothetical protein
MKAADHDCGALSPESQGDVGCPAELVRLDSDQADQDSLSSSVAQAADFVQRDPDHGFIHHMNSQVHVTEQTSLANVLGQAVQTSEAVAGHHGAPVTDDKAFVVVLRGPDQENVKDGGAPSGIHTDLLNQDFRFAILAGIDCTSNRLRW